jgi:hypothetical protein
MLPLLSPSFQILSLSSCSLPSLNLHPTFPFFKFDLPFRIHIWKDYPVNVFSLLLYLLTKFGIVYSVDNDVESLTNLLRGYGIPKNLESAEIFVDLRIPESFSKSFLGKVAPTLFT